MNVTHMLAAVIHTVFIIIFCCLLLSIAVIGRNLFNSTRIFSACEIELQFGILPIIRCFILESKIYQYFCAKKWHHPIQSIRAFPSMAQIIHRNTRRSYSSRINVNCGFLHNMNTSLDRKIIFTSNLQWRMVQRRSK